MKIKPIFIIGLPYGATQEIAESIRNVLEPKLKGYYLIIYLSKSKDYVFHCFNDINFKESNYDEIKNLITKQLQ